MNTRLIPVFLSLSFLLVTGSKAQNFDVPKNYKLEKAEDYAKYVPEILKCIDYLESTPLDSATEKRKEANAFLLKWLTGSPTVSIDLQKYVTDLSERNNDFMMIFMGGWTRYVLQSKNSPDKFECHLAGLRDILRVYQRGKGVKKDKKIEKLIALDRQEGKLDEWLRKTLQAK